LFSWFSLTVLILFVSGASAQAQSPQQLEKDFPVLSKAYSIAGQRADFIVAIDRSRSMNAIWPEIKAQLLLFVAALPEQDYVSILGFADEADNLLLPRTLNTESRGALLHELQQLPGPNEQPKGKGNKTDLRAAADLTLETLNRPGAANLTFVFVFTDFLHDPPTGAISKAAGIKLLSEKYTNYIEKTGKVVKAYAIQLPLSSDAGADIDILASAFGGKLSRVIATKSSLAEWFDQVRASFGREKLKALVEKDVVDPVTLIPSVSNSVCSVAMKNGSRLEFSISKLAVRAGDSVFTNDGPVVLGAAKEGVARATAAGYPLARLLQPKSSRDIPAEVSYTLKFTAEVELARLNLPAEKITRVERKASVCEGTPIWVHALIAGLLALLAWWAWGRWGRGKRPFDGRAVNATLFVQGQQVGGAVAIRPSGDGILSVGIDSFGDSLHQELQSLAARLQRQVALPQVTLKFVGARPKFPGSSPRRGTYIFLDDAGSGMALRQLYRLKTFAENADPSAEGRTLQTRMNSEDVPVPEHEDLFVHFRHAFEHQAAMDFQVLISPER
jgi:hypothetical protein